MKKTNAEIEEIGKDGERIFKTFCDYHEILYLEIQQAKGMFSSKIFIEDGKRPDFLITLPFVGSFLIEVKARTKKEMGFKRAEDKKIYQVFRFNKNEIPQLSLLQNFTNLKLWIVFVEYKNKSTDSNIWFIPIERINRLQNVRIGGDVYVPNTCCSHLENVARNNCHRCRNEICRLVDDASIWLLPNKTESRKK